jgi:hypothetical protein
MARMYLSPPHMAGRERELLLEAFDSNWIAPLGPQVDAFERETARRCGVGHAAALASGTAALELALRILGVGSAAETGAGARGGAEAGSGAGAWMGAGVSARADGAEPGCSMFTADLPCAQSFRASGQHQTKNPAWSKAGLLCHAGLYDQPDIALPL